MPRATGASRRHSGLSAAAAARKSATATATKPQAKPRESIPAGNWRILVRGLRRSMDASTSRLNAIAAERAPTIATAIQVNLSMVTIEENEVTKRLAAWAGIFAVATFFVGVWGMNFQHMPELSWMEGYPLSLVLMVVSAVGPYIWFKRKGWL